MFALAALGALVGCADDQAPIPERPTWVDDVRPILQANCFHCHGASANYPDFGTRRWDFYGLRGDARVAALGQFSDPLTLASPNDPSQFGIMIGYLKPDAADGDRMPPAPATRLSARDHEVLLRWMAAGYPPGQHNPNHPPTVTSEAAGFFRIDDPDRDQVFGKLTCGDRELLLPRSGGYALEGMTPPCTVAVYDGFDLVTLPLP
jgi:hypothetical protein